jgi:hypothetical protein
MRCVYIIGSLAVDEMYLVEDDKPPGLDELWPGEELHLAVNDK